jgi:hypothetical protein
MLKKKLINPAEDKQNKMHYYQLQISSISYHQYKHHLLMSHLNSFLQRL